MNTTALGTAVIEAAESRHSIRRYTDEPVTDAQLRTLVEAAGRAPSSNNVQPWRWVAVRDQAMKDRLQAAANNQQQVGAASVLLVLYTDTKDALEHIEETFADTLPAEKAAATRDYLDKTLGAQSDDARETWGVGQSYIALGYLLLIAESLGLGTSPMLGFDVQEVKSILGLPGHAKIPALVAIGHPAEEGFDSPRHRLDRILTEL